MKADFLLLLPIPLLRRISDGTGAMSLPLSHRQGRWSTHSRGAQLSHKTHLRAARVRPIFLPRVSQSHVPQIFTDAITLNLNSDILFTKTACTAVWVLGMITQGGVFLLLEDFQASRERCYRRHLWNRTPVNPCSAHPDTSQGEGSRSDPSLKTWDSP